MSDPVEETAKRYGLRPDEPMAAALAEIEVFNRTNPLEHVRSVTGRPEQVREVMTKRYRSIASAARRQRKGE